MMRALTSVLLLLLGWADIANAQGACEVDTVDFEVLPLEPFAADFGEPHDFVIRNERQWCRFWRHAYARILVIPLLEPPPCDRSLVDFQHEIVLASTTGLKSNGCFAVHFAEITRVPGTLGIQAFIDEWTPGPDCVCTAALEVPVEAVVVSKPVGPVEFVHQRTIRNCSR